MGIKIVTVELKLSLKATVTPFSKHRNFAEMKLCDYISDKFYTIISIRSEKSTKDFQINKLELNGEMKVAGK